MKVINSKNTWHIIFGGLAVLIVIILIFNLVFKRTEKKLESNSDQKSETLVINNNSSSTAINSGPKIVKATRKPFFTIFDTPSPTPSSTPSAVVTTTIVIDGDKKETKDSTSSTTATIITTKSKETVSDKTVSTTNIASSKVGFNILNSETNESTDSGWINPPVGYARDIGILINKLLKLVLAISTILVFGQLIIGGLQWITSGGDKGKVEQARGKLTAAVVGLIIVASSYAILHLALNFIGFQSINDLMVLL